MKLGCISLSLSPHVLVLIFFGHPYLIMDFELTPTINLRSRSFNVLQVPESFYPSLEP
jgi:hypothetical protein